MKKRIIILGTTLVIVSLLFFSFTKWKSNVAADSNLLNNRDLAIDNKEIHGPNLKAIPDLYYGIDTRFAAVSKSDVHKATSIYTFLNASEKDQIQHIKSVNLVVIKNNQQSELQAFGTTDLLTDAQMKLLRSMDYFNHFTIRTEFRGKNMETGIVEDKFFGPHITVFQKRKVPKSIWAHETGPRDGPARRTTDSANGEPVVLSIGLQIL